MSNRLRMYEGCDRWFITARCFQARKLMTPSSPLVREVCGGVLARAAEKYGVRVYAYVFMSNHLHLVIGARGPVVASFLQYLKGNLSRKLAPLCPEPWRGVFWEGRCSAIPILDEEALIHQVRYVVAHGVKEGLVVRAQEWEGLHCAHQLIDGEVRSFRWFDWKKRWLSCFAPDGPREEQNRYDLRWSQDVRLELAPLPQWQAMEKDARAAVARAFVAEAASSFPQKAPLGMNEVKAKGIEIPRWRKRSREATCHASEPDLGKAYREKRRGFVERFRAAAKEWLQGNFAVEFPPGAFRPFVHNEVQIV